MKIYDRHSGEYIETTQYGQGKLLFLYNNPLGRILLKLAINPVTSRFYGWLKSRPSSAKDIPEFIAEHNIDMSDYVDRTYNSFSDFFTRHLRAGARKIDMADGALISPADSKLLVYSIDEDLKMNIKGSLYTVNELVDNKTDVSGYSDGYALVFRLCMDDYHRYCFIDKGMAVSSYKVKGKLHTVSSISKDYKIYKENARAVNVLNTVNFGEIIQIEVGALLVGSIVNREVNSFGKGDEKGYFEPGGSTVIILLRNETAVIDEDILEQSSQGIETVVKYGERIGNKC